LDSLCITDVGTLASVPAEEDSQSERGKRRRAEAEEVGSRGWGTAAFSTHASFFGVRGRGVGFEGGFPL